MCFLDNMSAKLDVFKWRKRRQLSSDMDARFGDVSISAPNEGSWNGMAHLRPIHTQPSETHKISRLKTLFRSKPEESSGSMIAAEQQPAAVRLEPFQDQVPHHPMVDMEAHKRSLSVEGRRVSGGRRTAEGKLGVSTSLPRSNINTLDSPSSCSCDGDDEDEDEERSHSNIRRRTRDLPRRSQSQDSSQYHQEKARRDSRQHRSPPLASTGVMRRYSSQSTATSTFTSSTTPSTATFSSKHTSMTSAASHGLYAPSMPPRLREEVPPVPKVQVPSSPPLSATSSSRNAVWGKKSRAKSSDSRSNKRSTGRAVGPQELVPSYDELWGY